MRRTLGAAFLIATSVLFAPAASANHGGSHQIITGGPAPFTNSTSATFTFGPSGGTHSTMSCQLDAGLVETCDESSTKTYSGLAAGAHSLVVSGQGVATVPGCTVPPCEYTFGISDHWGWRIDLTKPTATMTAPVGWAQLGAAASVAWTASDAGGAGIKQFTLERKRAPYNGSFGSVTYTPFAPSTLSTSASLAGGSTDCFAIRAIDNANNVGAFSPWRCITRPMDDRALSRSAGWSLGTSSAYFKSTYTGTSSASRTLAKANAQVKRIGLVATKCAKCGTVSVRVGTTTVGTVNLFSSTTKFKQLISLPTISLRTGTVRVVTTTSGKPIYIDGLAVSRQ
jgi:hypothetical protein